MSFWHFWKRASLEVGTLQQRLKEKLENKHNQLNVNMYVNQTKYLELQSGNPYENKQCDRMQLLFCENVLKIISKLPCPGKPLACMTETSRTSLSMR